MNPVNTLCIKAAHMASNVFDGSPTCSTLWAFQKLQMTPCESNESHKTKLFYKNYILFIVSTILCSCSTAVVGYQYYNASAERQSILFIILPSLYASSPSERFHKAQEWCDNFLFHIVQGSTTEYSLPQACIEHVACTLIFQMWSSSWLMWATSS